MRKNYTVYIVITIIIAAAFTAACAAADDAAMTIAFAAAGTLAAALWSAYFFSIKYSLDSENLTVRSGVIFRRTKRVGLSGILMTSKTAAGKRVFLTVIRTAGEITLVYGDLPPVSRG